MVELSPSRVTEKPHTGYCWNAGANSKRYERGCARGTHLKEAPQHEGRNQAKRETKDPSTQCLSTPSV